MLLVLNHDLYPLAPTLLLYACSWPTPHSAEMSLEIEIEALVCRRSRAWTREVCVWEPAKGGGYESWLASCAGETRCQWKDLRLLAQLHCWLNCIKDRSTMEHTDHIGKVPCRVDGLRSRGKLQRLAARRDASKKRAQASSRSPLAFRSLTPPATAWKLLSYWISRLHQDFGYTRISFGLSWQVLLSHSYPPVSQELRGPRGRANVFATASHCHDVVRRRRGAGG